ncbi:MAG: paraquat-inducible protein A [Magnetococcales bacterium]|nr:paraquat-inducible protein A [Magnetococcales bacterium]
MKHKFSDRPDLSQLMACHECDLLYRLPPLSGRTLARCHRCGTVLDRGVENGLNKTLAFTVAALVFFLIANAYPVLALKAVGMEQTYTLFSGAMVLIQYDLWAVAVTVFLTSIIFPFLHIVGLLYVLTPLKYQRIPRFFIPAFRFSLATMPWAMVGVYMLGILVSIVKLADMATVVPGWGLYGLVGLLVVSVAAEASLNPRLIWQSFDRLRILS